MAACRYRCLLRFLLSIELEALVLSSEDDEAVSHYYPQQEPIPPGCHDILRILGLEPTYTPRVKIPYQFIRERARKRNSKLSVQLESVAVVAIVSVRTGIN